MVEVDSEVKLPLMPPGDLIPVAEIYAPSDWNCRGKINAAEIVPFAQKLQHEGLLQAIVIMPFNDPARPQYKWRAVAGFRRLMAARVNKWPVIACNIRTDLTEEKARAINLKENLDRKDLNKLQEAHGIKHFVEAGWTQEMIASELDQPKGWVGVRQAILKLEPEIQEVIAAGLLTDEQIMKISRLPGKTARFEAVKGIKEAKERGESTAAFFKKSVKRNPIARKRRTPAEILEMNGHLYDMLGPSLATRFGAWCAGEITDFDLLREIRKATRESGREYVPPDGYEHLRFE